MRMRWKLFAVALLFLTEAARAQATFTKDGTPWPDIPPPPKSKVQWVSDDMQINGIPMKVQTFQSQASSEEVVRFYVAHWRIDLQAAPDVAKPPAGVMHHGSDTLVSRAHGPFYSQVKVRARGNGSEGTVSTSRLLGVEPRIDPSGIPSPRSATAVNVVESIDNGKRSKAALLLTPEPIASVANFYQSHLRAGGWALLQEQAGDRQGGQPSALVRMYAKDKQQLDVALGIDAERNLTVINANLVTH